MPGRITIINIIRVNKNQHQLIYKANSHFKNFLCDNSDVVRYLGKHLEISPEKALKQFNEMVKKIGSKHDLFVSYLKFLHLI